MPTLAADLTDPATLIKELAEIRTVADSLIKRLDAVEAAEHAIATAARSAQVSAQTASNYAQDIADNAAIVAGRLRLAVAENLDAARRKTSRLADVMAEARTGRH